jgi:hypothetical protein
MSIVTTGQLAIERHLDDYRIETWQPGSGGEISFTITGGEYRDVTALGENWAHYRWTGKFCRHGRTLQIGFMQGTGLPGVPDAEKILASAFEDAASVEWDAFEGWAADMGYDPEDPDQWRRAKRIYNACERMGERLARFIPNDADRERWAEALSEANR